MILASPEGTPEDLAHAKIVVVFDNNAYRDLVEDLEPGEVDRPLAVLIAAERERGYQALLQPLIVMELASRLTAGGAQTQRVVRSSLVAAALHTELQPAGIKQIGALADPESLVAKAVFGQGIENNRQVTEMLLTLCRHVEERREGPLDPEVEALASGLKDHVASAEAGFAADMFAYLVQPFSAGVSTWAEVEKNPGLAQPALKFLRGPEAKNLFAGALIRKVADLINRRPSDAEVAAAAAWLGDRMGVAAALYNDICHRIIVQGCRLTKKNRVNWFWDLNLALCIGDSHSIAGLPVTLVTTDQDIVEAAQSAGARGSVMTFVEYRKSLGLA